MDRKDTNRITFQESNLLVPSGKSKRLAALRRQNRIQVPEDSETQEAAMLAALNQDVYEALREARVCIQRRIEQIKHHYPPGRQNKLFAIRYGDLECIKRRSIKEIFDLLAMEPDQKNFNLIEHRDFDGNEICGKKVGTVRKARKKRP